jgi:nucleoside-diphosphate-sugar epimerase
LIITGATGFIGRVAVAKAAASGFAVHALCRRVPDDAHTGVTYHAVDLIDDRHRARGLIRGLGASHWLHLAWYVEPGRFWTSRENFRWVAATLDLAESFADGGGRRLVAAGTCAEYDWAEGYCREGTTPLEPATPYGVAKDALRRLLAAWSEQARVSFAWGRVFFNYGPGERPERLVSSVIRSLLRGKRARCTDGSQRRDFLHVSDVADAFVRLTASEYEGAVNIASGQPVEVRSVVQHIAAAIGRPDLLDLGALSRGEEPPLLVGDTRRLRGALQWAPRFDLESGLEDTIAWHREQARGRAGNRGRERTE